MLIITKRLSVLPPPTELTTMDGFIIKFQLGRKVWTLIFYVWRRLIHLFVYSLIILFFQSGILVNLNEKLISPMKKTSKVHPEDELEVMGLGFFILPNIFLIVGLSISLACLLCELYIHSRK